MPAPAGLTFVTYEDPPGAHTDGERVRAFGAGPQPIVNVNKL